MVDFKVGYLHAYPNGELQFENYGDLKSNNQIEDADDEVQKINQKRFVSRRLEKDINDANLEAIARAMSQGSHSVNMKSCF